MINLDKGEEDMINGRNLTHLCAPCFWIFCIHSLPIFYLFYTIQHFTSVTKAATFLCWIWFRGRISQSNHSTWFPKWNHRHPVAMEGTSKEKYTRIFCAVLMRGLPQPDPTIHITAVSLPELHCSLET